MAVYNANYEFMPIDTGRNSDGSVFGNSDMRITFESNLLQVPEPVELSSTGINSSYVLIGDEAFPLKTYLMKPYP